MIDVEMTIDSNIGIHYGNELCVNSTECLGAFSWMSTIRKGSVLKLHYTTSSAVCPLDLHLFEILAAWINLHGPY